jgi:hypothetical protein
VGGRGARTGRTAVLSGFLSPIRVTPAGR